MVLFELILVFITGLCIGSFLNVLIDRLSHDESILGRSHCDGCKRDLTPLELIPVLSYFFQRGKSACCEKKLSFFYPFVEVLTGVVFALTWTFPPMKFLSYAYPNLANIPMMGIYGPSVQLLSVKLIMLVIVATIIVMFFADLKYFIIPDWMQLTFGYAALMLFFIGSVDFHAIVYRLGSGVVVALPLFAVYSYTRGKGLGFGDVKLAMNLGFFLGITYGFAALYVAFILGAIVGVGLLALHRSKMKSKIPFGPFILIGVLTVLFAFSQANYVMYLFYGVPLILP